MPVIRGKPIEEVFTQESQFHAMASRGKNLLEAGRTKYLRIALVLVGLIFITHHHLAYRLVVAHRPFGLPEDDSGPLRDAGGISVACESQAAGTLEPYLVHGVVQH